MSAFRKNDGRVRPHTRRMRFSGPLSGVICKRPFPEFVAKIRIRDSGHRRTSTSHVSKIATDRPLSKMRRCANDPKQSFRLRLAWGRDGTQNVPENAKLQFERLRAVVL